MTVVPATSGTARVTEIARQTELLIAKGFAKAAGMTQKAFRALIEPLAASAGDDGCLVVVSTALIPAHEQIARTELGRKSGFTTMEPADLARWQATSDVELPTASVWLIEDVETGLDTRGVRPDDALPGILAAGRSPLTLDEGLAVAIQHPEWLRDRNCFEMLGSRAGDKRVTGIWLSGGAPRLGWCWGGNPHTWLGMASCARRTSAT